MRPQGAFNNTTLLPDILLDPFSKAITKYGVKSLFFITIKDNTGKGRFQKIGKVNDWIRRYSNTFFIGRGTQGGNHFHILAGIEKNKNPIPVKGIHFNIQCISNADPYVVDETIARTDREMTYYMETKAKDIVDRYQISLTIPNMIKKHFTKISNQSKRLISKRKKDGDIERIISYIIKNIEEDRETEDRQEYIDYILKPK